MSNELQSFRNKRPRNLRMGQPPRTSTNTDLFQRGLINLSYGFSTRDIGSINLI